MWHFMGRIARSTARINFFTLAMSMTQVLFGIHASMPPVNTAAKRPEVHFSGDLDEGSRSAKLDRPLFNTKRLTNSSNGIPIA